MTRHPGGAPPGSAHSVPDLGSTALWTGSPAAPAAGSPAAAVTRSPGAVVAGRTAALLGVASATVHVLLGLSGELASIVMAAMALVCLVCAAHQWRGASLRTWRLTAAIDLVMLVVHTWLMGGPHTPLSGAHAGMDHGQGGARWMTLGLVFIGLQLAIAAWQARPGVRR